MPTPLVSFGLRYSAVEQLIADMHAVPDDRLPTLRSRLKHLKRLGFPAGVNTGTGRHVRYDARSILMLLLYFEVSQLGISPEKAIGFLCDHEQLVVTSTAGHEGRQMRTANGASEPLMLVVDPKSLSVANDLPRSAQKRGSGGAGTFGIGSDMAAIKMVTAHRRGAVVNISAVLTAAVDWLERSGVGNRAAFIAGLAA